MKFIKNFVVYSLAILFLFGCAKEYSVETGGKQLPAGNWEFKDSAREYMGQIDTAYITGVGNTKQLNLIGKSLDGIENWSLRLYADEFKVGNYKASLFQSSMKYEGRGKKIYEVNQLSGEFTVAITVINANLITGTFKGSARDSLNGLKTLFNGKFKSTFKAPIIEPESVGVLGTTGGNCDDVVISGEYKQGIAMVTTNTVKIKVVVATPGAYNIYTNSVNGVTFSKKGSFTTTGVQTVTLNASGTPALPGDQTFTLRYGNSQCAFKVNFQPGVTASNDYFPLTTNTNWTYGRIGSVSINKRVLPGKKIINGTEYSVVAIHEPADANLYDTSLLVRRTVSNYFGYQNFKTILGLDEALYGETTFLKDNVPVGNTWNSSTFNGLKNGQPVTFYFKYTIKEKDVSQVVGGFNLPNLIKVVEDLYVNSLLVSSQETWYAKNVGPVRIGHANKTYEVSAYQVF